MFIDVFMCLAIRMTGVSPLHSEIKSEYFYFDMIAVSLLKCRGLNFFNVNFDSL